MQGVFHFFYQIVTWPMRILAWPLRLLKKKSFWLIAIVGFYLFKVSLLSPLVTYWLEEALADTLDLEVEIGKFEGTLVSNVILRDIALDEADNPLSQLSDKISQLVPIKPLLEFGQLNVKEISVHYNFLAPLFGGRILREFRLIDPQIEVTLPAFPKQKKSTPSKGFPDLRKVDFAALLSHSPSVTITNANITIHQQQKTMVLKDFSLHHTPRQSDCKFTTFQMIEKQKVQQQIKDFYIAWGFNKEIFTLQKLALKSSNYPYPIVIDSPISLDLGTIGSYLAHLDVSFPGFNLQGKAHISSGLKVQIPQGKLNLAELTSLFISDSQLDKEQGQVMVESHLTMPNWDLSRFSSRTHIRIGPHLQAELPAPDSSPKDHAQFLLEISNLAFLEQLAQQWNPGFSKQNIEGHLRVANRVFSQQKQLLAEGRIDSNHLSLQKFDLAPLRAQWQVSHSPKKKNLHLKNFTLSAQKVSLQSQLEIEKLSAPEFTTTGSLELPLLSKILSPDILQGFDGKLASQWQFSGKLPADLNWREAQAQGQYQLAVDQCQVLGNPLGKFFLQIQPQLTKQQVTVPLELSWNEEKILQLQAHLSEDLSKWQSIKGKFQVTDIEQKLALLLPKQKLPPEAEGTISGQFHIQVLPQAPYSFRLALEVQGVQPQADLDWQMTLRLRGNRNKIAISQWRLKNKEQVLWQIGGQSFEHKRAVLKGKFQVAKIIELATAFLPQPAAKLTGEIHWQAEVKMAALDSPFPLQTRLQMKWLKQRDPLVPYSEIVLQSHAEITPKQIKLREFSLQIPGRLSLKNQALISLSKKTLQAKTSWHLPNLPEHLQLWKVALPSEIQTVNSRGTLKLQGTWQKGVALKGSLANQLEIASPFPFKTIRTHVAFQHQEKSVTFAPLTVWLDREKVLQTQLQLQLHKQLPYTLTTHLKYHKIQTLLQAVATQQQPPITGDIQVQVVSKGELLSPHKIPENQTKLSWRWQNGEILQKPCLPITGRLISQTKNGFVHLQDLSLLYDQQRFFSLKGQIGYQPQRQSNLSWHFNSQSLQALLVSFSPFLKSEIVADCQISGKLPGVSPDPELTVKSKVELEKVEGVELLGEKISWQSQVTWDLRQLDFSECAIFYKQSKIAQIQGQLGYRNSAPTHIDAKIQIGKLQEFFLDALPKGISKLNGDCVLLAGADGLVVPDKQQFSLETYLRLTVSPAPNQRSWSWSYEGTALSGRSPSDLIAWMGRIEKSDKLKASGTLLIEQQKISLRDQDLSLRDSIFRIQLAQQQIQIRGKTSIGGGKLLVTGNITPTQGTIEISGKRILLIRSNHLYGRADCALAINGKWNPNKQKAEVNVSGKVDITEFSLTQPVTISMQPQPKRVQTAQLPSVKLPFAEINFDLAIHLNKVTIVNNFVNIESKGSIFIRGTNVRPQISGWIRTRSGKLFLPQGVMNIKDCLIRIQPESPLKPQFDIKAETRVRNYLITVTIEGDPDNIDIKFSSSPPLPQEDILALLTTGGTRAELAKSGTETLKRTGSSILVQQILHYFGLDTYISAQVSDKEGSVTISPPSWGGFAVQTKVDRQGNLGLNFLYRILFD